MRAQLAMLVVVGAALAAAGCRADRETTTARYELGRSATPTEIASLDTDVRPDGHGLPTGHGSVATGTMLYQQKCQMCHGTKGEGLPPAYPAHLTLLLVEHRACRNRSVAGRKSVSVGSHVGVE